MHSSTDLARIARVNKLSQLGGGVGARYIGQAANRVGIIIVVTRRHDFFA